MKTNILDQLARSGLLLPDVGAAVLAGDPPPLEEIALHLVIAASDGYAVVLGAAESSKQERCLAHMVLAAAFLSALAVLGKTEKQCGVPTATLQDGEL
jgi:hypothetical protein